MQLTTNTTAFIEQEIYSSFILKNLHDGLLLNIGPGGGAPDLGTDLLPNEIPTTTMGSGYNMLVLFDNMAYWNENWGTTGNGVFVSDVVVSTERIGHTYTAGSVQ